MPVRSGFHVTRHGVWAMGLSVVCGLVLVGCGPSVPTPAPSIGPAGSGLTPSSGQTVGEADINAATAVLTTYMTEVSKADFDGAWSLLSAPTQEAFGSKAQFAADRAAFMQTARGVYRLGTPSHDAGLFSQWLPSDDPGNPPLGRAFLAQVEYPVLSGNPAGFDILVAAPDVTGTWLVWKVR
jgi:hypothetical protein